MWAYGDIKGKEKLRDGSASKPVLLWEGRSINVGAVLLGWPFSCDSSSFFFGLFMTQPFSCSGLQIFQKGIKD